MTTRYVWLEELHGGQLELTNGKESQTIPRSFDLIPLAEAFGMRLRHKRGCPDRRYTDGTSACFVCGQEVDAFFGQALAYLEPRIEWGTRIVDPGFFTA